jgi:flagellar hook-basal body complex protein FliE
VNTDVNAADTQVRSLVLGESDNVHGVLIALETARVSMGVMVQVRNRLVDAYQDVMRMQI